MAANGGTANKHGFGMGQQDWENGYAIPAAGTLDAAQGRARGSGINPGQIVGIPPIVSQAMTAKWSKGSSGPAGDEVVNLIPIVPPLRGGDGGGSHGPGTDNDTVDSLVVSVAPTLRAGGNQTGGDRPPGSDVDTADSLIPISSIAFPERMSSTQSASAMDLSPALGATNPTAVAFDMRGREGGAQFEGPHDTANIRAASGGSSRSYVASWAVRRLTVVECERLQGYQDGYTDVPYRKRNWTPDGPRYKALGNSMATNVMRVIGERIDMVERLILK